jgi:hypothetical protein
VKAADLLGIADLRTKSVEVPKWGVTLTIRELSLEQGVKLSRMYRDMDGDTAALKAEDIAQVVAWGVVDNGERVFSDDDVPKLAQKNRDVLLALYTEIVGLSGEPEEAEKN